MNRQDADQWIAGYIKPVFAFALKRCARIQDAEDLSQEIILRAYRALIARDDIDDAGKFIWTVAHNALSNYYRGRSRAFVGMPLDSVGEPASQERGADEEMILQESTEKLHGEIAYLSAQQRRIVIAHYFENRRQADIASEMGIPVGTVKWHLSEAKKELKKGMDTMRKAGELKFNPIQFALCGTNGATGSKGGNGNFFRGALSQNIAYAVWKEAKTINEIADELGVSPVYVESEAGYLAEYGFLTCKGGKYLCNILLDESTEEINRLHDAMYEEAAKLFANELYDELMKSDIWQDEHISGGCIEAWMDREERPKDLNFFLWALIPYIAAYSGESMMEERVSFDEAATIRPDGGHNICYASVNAPGVQPPKYFDSMQNSYCGPFWNASGAFTLWQVDTEWSDHRFGDDYPQRAQRALSLLKREQAGGELSAEEYAFLVQQGYLRTIGSVEECFCAARQCVWIEGKEMRKKLLNIGDQIRERHRDRLEQLKTPYVEAVLKDTPAQLRKMRQYGLQFIFYADGWFILHCLKTLVENGRLIPPKESQKQALSTIIYHE